MYQGFGILLKGVGGLFTVRLFAANTVPEQESFPPQPLDGQTVFCRGRGVLKRRGALLAGDRVRVTYDASAFTSDSSGATVTAQDGSGIAIEEILPRQNALIRPPMANLDLLFVTTAAASPDPDLHTLDKLLCIAEFNQITPVMVITKCDRDDDVAQKLADIYQKAGFDVFLVVGTTGEGVDALCDYVNTHANGKISAFSGASGVGKSTLLNRIFPDLSLTTGEISQRIERGKNTTRYVELYPLSDRPDCGLLADTPGFTMLDFERFHFFDKDDLVSTFREFSPYIGHCKYKKCTHTKEDGCAIRTAVREGVIPSSRHKSYVALFDILKNKHDWEK